MAPSIVGDSFASKLYLALCIDAIVNMMGEESDIDEKAIEIIEPLMDELFSEGEFLA